MSEIVLSHLCSLLSRLERPEQDASYSLRISGLSSLSELVHTAISACKSSRHLNGADQLQVWRPNASPWIMHNADDLYKLNILKRCILTQFQLLCISQKELTSNEEMREACGEIAAAAELFNSQTPALFTQDCSTVSVGWMNSHESSRLSLADFIEVYVSCRSRFTADKLLCIDCDADKVLGIARHEALFIKSFISTFDAHSSLLCEHPADRVAQDSQIAGCSAGHQEMLTRTERLVASEFWKEVAVCLREGEQLRACGDRDFAATVQNLILEPDLAAAAKCLQYVATAVSMEETMMEWDRGFQSMLAASQKPTHGKKPYKPVEFLCSAVLPPIQSAIALAGTEPGPRALVTPASIAEHVDCLSVCRHISTPLETSVRAIASTLIASLESSLAGWNLSMLARFIFEEAPRASSAVRRVTAEAWKVLPPVVFFPAYSGLALEERQTRIDYDTLHKTCSRMDEDLERVGACFHDFLSDRYRQCILNVFPADKHWKAIGKKSSAHAPSQPSTYCDVVVEQLVLPVAEAALPLSEQAQRAYMELSASILFNEYRKAITRNKRTYRPVAGRQLLVDFRHLSQWLTSEKLGLHNSTLQSLSSLPATTEIEQGLQLLCGTTLHTDSGSSQVTPEDSSRGSPQSTSVRGLSSLPVWKEMAWYSITDWQECVM